MGARESYPEASFVHTNGKAIIFLTALVLLAIVMFRHIAICLIVEHCLSISY
jgi:hypothetical protein